MVHASNMLPFVYRVLVELFLMLSNRGCNASRNGWLSQFEWSGAGNPSGGWAALADFSLAYCGTRTKPSMLKRHLEQGEVVTTMVAVGCSSGTPPSNTCCGSPASSTICCPSWDPLRGLDQHARSPRGLCYNDFLGHDSFWFLSLLLGGLSGGFV